MCLLHVDAEILFSTCVISLENLFRTDRCKPSLGHFLQGAALYPTGDSSCRTFILASVKLCRSCSWDMGICGVDAFVMRWCGEWNLNLQWSQILRCAMVTVFRRLFLRWCGVGSFFFFAVLRCSGPPMSPSLSFPRNDAKLRVMTNDIWRIITNSEWVEKWILPREDHTELKNIRPLTLNCVQH